MFNVYQQVESETAHRVTVYNLQKSAILQVPAWTVLFFDTKPKVKAATVHCVMAEHN